MRHANFHYSCDPSRQNRAVVCWMHFKIFVHLYGEKTKKSKKKSRSIFDYKIALLHPNYIWEVSTLSWCKALLDKTTDNCIVLLWRVTFFWWGGVEREALYSFGITILSHSLPSLKEMRNCDVEILPVVRTYQSASCISDSSMRIFQTVWSWAAISTTSTDHFYYLYLFYCHNYPWYQQHSFQTYMTNCWGPQV